MRPAALASLVVFSAGPTAAESSAPPSLPTARAELAALKVAPQHSMNGYSRSKFDIWARYGHCTTQQTVLARDGKGVVDKPGSCQPAKGSWYSPYDDTTITTVSPGRYRPPRAPCGRLEGRSGQVDR
ncbi:hypothetical protein ABZ769_15340 [Streptomyces olivoreticuli]